MTLLVVLTSFLLLSVTESRPDRSHLSDSLRLKCDSLPYRTFYSQYRCYVAVLEQIEFEDANEQCATIFFGARIATTIPAEVFKIMMVDKSKFHLGKKSSGAKQIICTFGREYKCDTDDAMLEEGRCLMRAEKKMNFADAKTYCAEQGMELPAPENDLDNRIVKVGLINGPVWVQKSFGGPNGNKWNQGRNYARWTTCDNPTGQNPLLYSGSQNGLWKCKKDIASVIDTTGYWSNGGTENLMDVLCIKNAANDFTYAVVRNKSASVEPCISYHEMSGLPQLTAAPSGLSITCYAQNQTTTRYEVIGKGTVETKRGCEILCDSKPTCAAFSFQDLGLSSSCILLSSKISNKTCTDQTTIFKKKKSGCVARTDLAAEFGDDPCIESRNDTAFRGFNTKPICDKDKNALYVIRAIDANGRRITLDNERHNYMRKSDNGMFEYVFHFPGQYGGYVVVPIVAASCAVTEGEKCPCEPLKHMADARNKPNYPATTDRINPCNSTNSFIWVDVAKSPAYGYESLERSDTAKAFVTCRAGMWILYKESLESNWGITAAACVG